MLFQNEFEDDPVFEFSATNHMNGDDLAHNADDEVVVPKKDNIKVKPGPVKKDVKPAIVKPKVSKNADDALSSILGNKGGDGNDSKGGNKGSANGNLDSNGYYGNGSGAGSGGGNV